MTAAHSMDPTGAMIHADATALREAGAACPVVLPGGVPGMIISRYRELRTFLADPKVAKNARHFAAYQEGRIPAPWRLDAFTLAPGMTTADGDDHRRLRGLAVKALTPRRVAAMRPRIERLAADLLAALPEHTDADGVVDLRRHFACPLPMGVICELLGVDPAYRERLHVLSYRMTSAAVDMDAEDAPETADEILAILAQVVRDRRAAPGEDLTSALIAARDDGLPDGTGQLSDQELTETLGLMIVAGHEPTMNLIINAVRALSGHPEQLALVLAGEVSWDAVVEETLRWDGPVANFPFRYPITDVVVDGTPVPRGTAVLAAYSAAGRDPREYGPDAGCYDVTRLATRPAERHLAFGHGAHYCLGAPLARLEAMIALRALYAAWPDLTPTVPDELLPPLPGFVGNGVAALPVRPGPPGRAV